MKCLRAGRCGERIERRRWRMKRDERVAAVKILSVRRKAARKFWAPQQDHRPLRKRNKKFGKRAAGDMKEGPSFGFLGKKIPASKAGSILPYYGGGDNARKNFVGGKILSHTMIFF